MFTACFLPARCTCLRRDWLPYPISAPLSGSGTSAFGMGHPALAVARPGAWSKRLRQAKVQEADQGRKNKISGI